MAKLVWKIRFIFAISIYQVESRTRYSHSNLIVEEHGWPVGIMSKGTGKKQVPTDDNQKGNSTGEGLAEGDDGFAAVVVVEGDLAVGHGPNVGARVGGDQGGVVGVGEAEEPVQAVHLLGQADGAGVLDEGERHGLVVGWGVVFQQHVVWPVDVDLRAVFVDAVARDAAQRVSDVEALAVDHREDDQDEDDGGDDFFHGVVSILAARAKSKGKDERRVRKGRTQRSRCLSASLFTFLLFSFTSSLSTSTSLSSLRGTPARC